MNWTQFFEELKADKVQSLYLFTGPEAYVKRSALEKLREKLLPPGLEALNESVLEDATAQAIIEACETLPVMADRRLVVARDYAPLLPGKAKAEAEESERLCTWLPTAPESCCLVFLMRDAFDGRKKLAAQLVKLGAQVAFDPLTDPQLEKWLDSQARALGGAIEPAAARQLAFLAGRDLTRLAGELEKLCAYAGPGKAVNRAMVEELVPPSLGATVFQMIDSLMDGQTARAFTLVKTMLRAGENRMGILYMLTRQMRLLTHMKLLKNQGLALPQIEKRLSLNHYAAARMERQMARFTQTQLESAYRACVEADYAIKSGKARDEAALDQLLLGLRRQA